MSRLFVLGNASIDVTLRVPRLALPGETLMATGLARSPGGKGLNQAVIAARAGASVHFCAPVGPDAGPIPAALAAEGFAHLRLIASEAQTDLSTLVVAEDGENIIISTGACADSLSPYTARVFARPIRPDDFLLVQGNLPEASTWEAVSSCRNTIFNTAPIRWASPRIQQAARIVIANSVEATQLTGETDPEAAAARLGPHTAIVTLGRAGCLLWQEGTLTHLPAPEVTAVDTTGAGDVFCGVLAARLSQGLALPEAIGQAQAAAALCVARPGCFPSFPTAAELAQLPYTSPGNHSVSAGT